MSWPQYELTLMLLMLCAMCVQNTTMIITVTHWCQNGWIWSESVKTKRTRVGQSQGAIVFLCSFVWSSHQLLQWSRDRTWNLLARGVMQQMFPNEFRNPGKVTTISACDADPSCRKVLMSLNPVPFLGSLVLVFGPGVPGPVGNKSWEGVVNPRTF